MNGQMSSKGEFGLQRYNDDARQAVQQWVGRAYWIGEDLEPGFKKAQKQTKKALNLKIDRAVNKQEGALFRKTLGLGLWKHKAEDFKTQEQIREENAVKWDPWNTEQFEIELNKAFIQDIEARPQHRA